MSDLNHQRDIWVLFAGDVMLAVIIAFDWQAYKMSGVQGRPAKCNPYHPVTEAAPLPPAPPPHQNTPLPNLPTLATDNDVGLRCHLM